MTHPRASVIVVSHGRPRDLTICIKAVRQLVYHPFEVVVVADTPGLTQLARAGLDKRIKTVRFDKANIAFARNLGIEQAAGDVIAFLDDDAIAEPAWLYHLVGAFADASVAAAGGFVLGRNGISFRNMAETVDVCAQTHDLSVPLDRTTVHTGTETHAIKTQGTNCAFRREDLVGIGGFDPAFRYYLDDSDVNIRLAQLGKPTAIVPKAVVHHKVAESPSRDRGGRPRSLYDIGASTAHYLSKHAATAACGAFLQNAEILQRRRLVRHMVGGTCEPRDVEAVLKTFRAGARDGRPKDSTSQHLPGSPSAGFLPLSVNPNKGEHKVLFGHHTRANQLKKEAKILADAGAVVSLFLFSFTALYHKVRYHPDGYWVQTGGVYGRSRRDQPVFQPFNIQERTRAELRRVESIRFPWDGKSKKDKVS